MSLFDFELVEWWSGFLKVGIKKSQTSKEV